jgi:hypothetical protein
MVDQNLDETPDAGDLTSLFLPPQTITIGGANLTGVNLTLPATNATAFVYTTHKQWIGAEAGYVVSIKVQDGIKHVTSVTVTSGPNILAPLDIGCLSQQFNFNNYGNMPVRPTAGDTYQLLVGYSDLTSETVFCTVTGVLDAFPQNLSTTGASSVTPSFAWSAPVAPPAEYSYWFGLAPDSNQNIAVWQIPAGIWGAGLSSGTSALAWAVDPTNGSNDAPNPNPLASATEYVWDVSTGDANSNKAKAFQTFTTP